MDHAACEDVARRVDECHFAARAIAGVKPENGMPCERRLQEELAKVVPEYGNRLFLGGHGQLCAQFAFERGDEQTLVAVLNRGVQFFLENRGTLMDPLVNPCDILLVVEGEADREAALLLSAIDGENPMRGECADGLAVAVVHLKDLCILGIGVERRLKDSVPPKLLAHEATQLRLVHDRLGEDITGTRKCVGDCWDFLFCIYIRCSCFLKRARRLPLEQHRICQSLKSALACNGGTCPFFLFVWTVEILECLQLGCVFNRRAELVRQFTLLLDASDDFLLPFDKAAQIGETCLHLAQHLILKRAGCLLAVPCDERDRVAVVEECDDGCGLLRTDGKFARNGGGNVRNTHGTKPFFLLFNAIHYSMILERRKRKGCFLPQEDGRDY